MKRLNTLMLMHCKKVSITHSPLTLQSGGVWWSCIYHFRSLEMREINLLGGTEVWSPLISPCTQRWRVAIAVGSKSPMKRKRKGGDVYPLLVLCPSWKPWLPWFPTVWTVQHLWILHKTKVDRSPERSKGFFFRGIQQMPKKYWIKSTVKNM